MKCYEDKCHILLNADETLQENIGTSHINNSKCKKLLGIKFRWSYRIYMQKR